MNPSLCANCPNNEAESLLKLITPEEKAHVENYLRNLEDFDIENAGEPLSILILAYSIYGTDVETDIICKTVRLLGDAYRRGKLSCRSSCKFNHKVELTSCVMKLRFIAVMDFLKDRWDISKLPGNNTMTQQEREEYFRTRMHRGKTLLERIMNR